MRALAVVMVCAVLVAGCASRKKVVETNLSNYHHTESLAETQSDVNVTITHYSDTLGGVWLPIDTTDSATFESAGVKLKLKATKTKDGKTKLDFSATAKPVSRSTLTAKTETKTAETAKTSATLTENKQEILTRFNLSFWLYLLAFFAGAGLVVWLAKKVKQWISF